MLDTDKIIIFCGRKVRADDLSCDMILRGISCQLIHGDRDQMDREQAIADIKSGIESSFLYKNRKYLTLTYFRINPDFDRDRCCFSWS